MEEKKSTTSGFYFDMWMKHLEVYIQESDKNDLLVSPLIGVLKQVIAGKQK